MNDRKLDDKLKQLIFKQKIRCNMCYEIPIIKEIVNGGELAYFISAECLNKHGVFYCTLNDFCSDKNQIDKIKCHNCNKEQGIVDHTSKLFHFCRECHKFLCPSCYNTHYRKFQNNHRTTKLDDIDFICKEHGMAYAAFCSKCNMNICNYCQQRNHSKHENKYIFNNIMPIEQKIKDASTKIEMQKKQIEEINKILDSLLKITNQIKEYQTNLKAALKFNIQVFNCFEEKKANYQSIVNFDKILDIDIADISWVLEVQNNLDKLKKFIKSQSSTISQKNPNNTNNIDKDLMDSLKKTVIGNENRHIIDALEDQNYYDFTDNELLKEIGKKNQRIIKKEEIIGELKNIYIMNECNNYLILADNGIFIYDQETNDLLSYIDVNENLEYDEVNSLSYYYNKIKKIIYLFVGTNTNKIKVYCIDENEEYSYELIEEIKIEKIKNIFCNEKGDLLVIEDNSSSIYKIHDNKYEQEKEIFGKEREAINLYSTENYLICATKEKQKIIFYDKKDFEALFSVDNVSNNDKSKIIEISKNLLIVSFKNIIQVIDVEKKSISYCFDKINMDYIESIDLMNEKDIFISCNLSNKLTAFILELDDSKKTFKEKKKIEGLNCKLIQKIDKNKVILYTKYGVNIIGN